MTRGGFVLTAAVKRTLVRNALLGRCTLHSKGLSIQIVNDKVGYHSRLQSGTAYASKNPNLAQLEFDWGRWLGVVHKDGRWRE